MTKYGRSPWLDRFPASRVPSYPRQRGAIHADAVIVGGGLTGCLAAHAFAAAGNSVVLLEADRIGRGVTASSSGWISEEPGIAFSDLESVIGVRGARRAFQSWRRAALDFAALLRRDGVVVGMDLRGAGHCLFRSGECDRCARRQARVPIMAASGAGFRGPFAARRRRRRDGSPRSRALPFPIWRV